MRIFHDVTFYCVLMCCHESRESPRRLISGFSILSSSFVYWVCFYQGFSTNEIKVFCFSMNYGSGSCQSMSSAGERGNRNIWWGCEMDQRIRHKLFLSNRPCSSSFGVRFVQEKLNINCSVHLGRSVLKRYVVCKRNIKMGLCHGKHQMDMLQIQGLC